MTHFKLNSPDVSAEHFDNEVLTVNIVSGRYYSIKNTAAIFLRLVLDGNSKENAVAKIAELFAVNTDSINHDFNTLVSELIVEKIIVESTKPEEILSNDWLAQANIEMYVQPMVETHTDMEELALLS